MSTGHGAPGGPLGGGQARRALAAAGALALVALAVSISLGVWDRQAAPPPPPPRATRPPVPSPPPTASPGPSVAHTQALNSEQASPTPGSIPPAAEAAAKTFVADFDAWRAHRRPARRIRGVTPTVRAQIARTPYGAGGDARKDVASVRMSASGGNHYAATSTAGNFNVARGENGDWLVTAAPAD